MANHSLPLVSSLYADYTSELDARVDDALLGLDPATTSPTNVPTNSIRWTSAASRWEKWNGTTWGVLAATYAISVSGNAATATTATTASTLVTARTLTLGASGKTFDGSANVTWTLAEMGAAAASATLNLTGDQTAAGNKTFSGTITALDVTITSDERLKSDWSRLPYDFVSGLASVECGTYNKIGMTRRQAGVSAQSLRWLLPEAVHEDDQGVLSVAYGNAALVAAVELAREVKALRKELEHIKAQLP